MSAWNDTPVSDGEDTPVGDGGDTSVEAGEDARASAGKVTRAGTGKDAPSGARPPRALPVAGPRRTRREVRRRLGAHRGRLAAALLTLVAGTAVTLTTPPLLGAVVDAVVDRAAPGRVLVLGLLLVLAAAAGALSALVGGRMLAALVQDVLAGLREDVFRTAVHLPADLVESSGSGDVVSRVTRDVEAVSEAASDVLPDVTAAGLTVALSVVGLAVLDPRLALAGLVCLPVHVLATRWFLARSHAVYGDVRRLESERGQSVVESVHGAATVRAYREQDRRLAELARRSLRAVERQRDGARLRNRFTGLLNAAEFLGLAAVLTTGFALVRSGQVSLGAATAAALYFHRLFDPIGALLRSLDDIQRATVGLARLVGITDLGAPDGGDPVAPRETEPGTGIGVEDVSYTYDGVRPVLRGIRLEVPAGTSLALVGASGSGKSTLARLIAGLDEPTRGRITAGGGARYLVTQETHLFGGTLADNLRLARPGATDAELADALREVGADWALTGEYGLGTVLGPGGTPLDDGAVQHLALARVLLADPPVVVLDEATAESGPRTQALLRSALARVVRGRTAVIVAHRLEQARDADRVLVLDRGETAGYGSHAELLSRPGEYAALWEAYTSAGAVPGPRPPGATGGAPSGPGDAPSGPGGVRSGVVRARAGSDVADTGSGDADTDSGDAPAGVGESRTGSGDARTGVGEDRVGVGEDRVGVGEARTGVVDARPVPGGARRRSEEAPAGSAEAPPGPGGVPRVPGPVHPPSTPSAPSAGPGARDPRTKEQHP
ncbi:ABC transporter transmembrane domain-containing protein [Streptomyces sp. NPDC052077]|uniref:ABC transporter transmembrane domain-containing protein n=1 Tax=Streptomyces sp. NPDC052077 TaxID=3154757 RepID=UPI00342BFC12